MNKALRILGQSTVLAGCAALVACGGPGYDPESPEGQAYEARHELMEQAGQRMELINNMAREQIELDEPAFVAAAVELAELTSRMPDTFDEPAIVPISRSDPAIWQNKDDFDARMQEAIEATAELAEVAQNEGFGAAQQLVTGSPTTASRCSGCHNTYRLPEEN